MAVCSGVGIRPCGVKRGGLASFIYCIIAAGTRMPVADAVVADGAAGFGRRRAVAPSMNWALNTRRSTWDSRLSMTVHSRLAAALAILGMGWRSVVRL